MIRIFIDRHWHGFVMACVLATLAITAPHVNAAGQPPSQVFVEWPKGRPAPEVRLTAGQYAQGGWYIDISADGFVFTDLCQSVDGPQTIGHAHVYQGHEKIASAFHPRVSLGELGPGTHNFSAMLRAQDHRALIGPEGLLKAEITITIPGHRGS
ncbi:MAG: hypothetical protein AAGH68_01355 [Pseudomonadota bacterium]